MSINQRFKTLLYKLDSTASQLADELNVAKSTVTKSINGDTLPSSKILIPLGEKLNISVDWLLFGKGEMFLNNKNSSDQKIINGDGNTTQIGHNNEFNNNSEISNKIENEFLKSKIELLEKSLEDKEKLISMLEKNQR